MHPKVISWKFQKLFFQMSMRVFSFNFVKYVVDCQSSLEGLIDFGYKSMRKVEVFWEGPPLYIGDMQEHMI